MVRLLRPIPGLAWVPFAIIWFGVSTPAAVFIVAVGVFWICYFATLGAVRAVDRDLLEVADAYGFRSPIAKLVKIVLPAAAPGILSGLRTALGQAWMAVVAAEIFGVMGLGQRMMQASSLLATDIVVVYMITMAGALRHHRYRFRGRPGAHSRVEGLIVSDALISIRNLGLSYVREGRRTEVLSWARPRYRQG